MRFIKVCLSLLVLLSFLQCNRQKTSNCSDIKIQLLLEDFLRKERCFVIFKTVRESLDKNVIIPPDSTMYFGYLHSPKFKIPNKDFYLHWNNELEPNYPDSIKLKVIKDLSEMNAVAFVVGIDLSEVNEDSTKVKLSFDSGIVRTIDCEGTYTYSFDDKNCKWNVLDSTISYSISK